MRAMNGIQDSRPDPILPFPHLLTDLYFFVIKRHANIRILFVSVLTCPVKSLFYFIQGTRDLGFINVGGDVDPCI